MKQEKPKRNRINQNSKKIPPKEILIDEALFVKNNASMKAKQVMNHVEGISFKIWMDKHYLDRLYFGDINGRRCNIEKQEVISLVRDAIKYLIFYSALTKYFHFLNFEKSTLTFYPNRLIIKKHNLEGFLNVVVEIHYYDIKDFEITIITAMYIDDFKMADGQFCILIDDQGGKNA